MIGEGIVACYFKDDDGETHASCTKMTCAPMSEYILGMQEKEKFTPKHKRSTCHKDDEEAALTFEDRRRKLTINHDPKMLFPVLNINLGVNVQPCNATFKNVT